MRLCVPFGNFKLPQTEPVLFTSYVFPVQMDARKNLSIMIVVRTGYILYFCEVAQTPIRLERNF